MSHKPMGPPQPVTGIALPSPYTIFQLLLISLDGHALLLLSESLLLLL
jgi:hypothetical protein